MRNDLHGLVWVPGREILVPGNASEEELMVVASVLHEAEHYPYDEVDEGCAHSLIAAECPVCNFDDEFWAQTEQGVQE